MEIEEKFKFGDFFEALVEELSPSKDNKNSDDAAKEFLQKTENWMKNFFAE